MKRKLMVVNITFVSKRYLSRQWDIQPNTERQKVKHKFLKSKVKILD